MVGLDILISLIPGLPLLGFLMVSLFNKHLSHAMAAGIACGSVLVSFALSVLTFSQLLSLPVEQRSFHVLLSEWISTGNISANISFLIDPLSAIMLLVITGVGLVIHVYSVGYMHGDPGFNKFFSYMNLFVFFMLLLVMGSNYLLMFVGWEGVGLCSYLLIGFWFRNDAYNLAANKAFIMNRIGDLGLLLGVILIFIHTGSFEYADVFAGIPGMDGGIITLIAILLFIGATGKSAQIPLYTWLPDAMAGPTPVSALIHAATMVTAGVYMVVRNNLLYSLAPFALEIILVIGLATALFAATIALTQNDIKKVLAYSTVSQLGLMFVALGLGAFSSGIFHMVTHAFFKALLFLGAGSIIHALHGEQDIRQMGGLKKFLPLTHLTFFIAVLAISGIPPFAGFFSKDEILAHAFAHQPLVWGLAMLSSLLTVFYMFRLYFLTFYGQARASAQKMQAIHESPGNMTIPLIILAVLSVTGGFLNVPEILGGSAWLHQFLEPVTGASHAAVTVHPLSHATEYVLMGIVVAFSAVVIYFAYQIYMVKKSIPAAEGAPSGALQNLVYNKYYVDEFYQMIISRPLHWISEKLDVVVERLGIDRLVNSTGVTVVEGSKVLRLLQYGSIGVYIFVMVVSVVVLLALSLIN